MRQLLCKSRYPIITRKTPDADDLILSQHVWESLVLAVPVTKLAMANSSNALAWLYIARNLVLVTTGQSISIKLSQVLPQRNTFNLLCSAVYDGSI